MTPTLPTTRPRTAERAAGKARPKAGQARRDLEGTDAFTCPSEPDESLTVKVESFSRIAQMILRAAMDEQGLYPGNLVSTIRNGHTEIVPGKYEVTRVSLPITEKGHLARYHVKRLETRREPEFTYTVDVRQKVNSSTGALYEIPMCEADQCGAYANTYGENGDVRYCKHCERVAIEWESLRDAENAQEKPALPVAPIASQEAVCLECKGTKRVQNEIWPEYSGSRWVNCPSCVSWKYSPIMDTPTFCPDCLGSREVLTVTGMANCPTCNPEETEPRSFYDEDDYRPPVSAETRAMDWEN